MLNAGTHGSRRTDLAQLWVLPAYMFSAVLSMRMCFALMQLHLQQFVPAVVWLWVKPIL